MVDALAETYGAFFIGVLFATFFQGVLTVQAYIYYENFPRDHISLKSLVAIVWLIDLIHLVLITQSCYHYLIHSWGDNAALLVSTQALDLHLVFVGLASVICQLFFLSRIWRFSQKNWILTGILGIPCVLIFVLEVFISVEISRTPNVAAFSEYTGEVLSVFALAASVDVAIAVILVWYLQQGKTSFERILAVADLIVYLATPRTFVFIAMHFSMGRMYTNAFLATLNSRRKLRQVLDGGGANIGPPTDGSMGPSFFAGMQMTNNTTTSGELTTQRSGRDEKDQEEGNSTL
ncbi:ANK-REP-REGION domain-containing protein [Mycena kentingensis (nom. inval.)]|nr:ANK-REP-REGION domain-containing protein [Mycena kentingensis (nom. inval.)]